MKNIKYFYGSFSITFIIIVLFVIFIPPENSHTIYIVIMLILLEVSLSIDNAIINAKILITLSKKWKLIFIWIGLPIAVFGMRFAFPIIIISFTTSLSIFETCYLALNNSQRYHELLNISLPYIYSFGSSFLMMVFLNFFFVEKRVFHWITHIENNRYVNKIRQFPGIHIIIAILIGYFIIIYKSNTNKIALAFLLGIIIHEVLNIINFFLKKNMSGKCVRNGLAGFLYLEFLDASFSLDGVIGAFAISKDILIIALGLGIGAIYVRSLTIFFAECQILKKFRYLEHGASYAIGFLSIVMLVKIYTHVPEWITGTVSISLILSSFMYSIIKNK